MQNFYFKEFKNNLDINELKAVISNIKKEDKIKSYLKYRLKNITKEDNYDIDLVYDCEEYFIIITNRYATNLVNGSLTSYYNNVLITPISKNFSMKYKKFYQDQNDRIDILDKSKKLKEGNEYILDYDEFLEINSFTDIIQINDCTEGFLLEVHFKNYLDYVWEYDMQTLFPIGYSCVVRENYRLEHTLKLMEKIKDINSIEGLVKLCKHDSHIIRWESLKLLINLDLAEGLNILNNMQLDNHPEVKIAAVKSINKLRDNGYNI